LPVINPAVLIPTVSGNVTKVPMSDPIPEVGGSTPVLDVSADIMECPKVAKSVVNR